MGCQHTNEATLVYTLVALQDLLCVEQRLMVSWFMVENIRKACCVNVWQWHGTGTMVDTCMIAHSFGLQPDQSSSQPDDCILIALRASRLL